MNARDFLTSLAGRVFAILALGMLGAAMLGIALVTARSRSELEQQTIERTVDRIEGIAVMLDSLPADQRNILLRNEPPPGIRIHPPGTPGRWADEPFTRTLQKRGGSLQKALAQDAQPEACLAGASADSRQAIEHALQDESVRRIMERTLQNSGARAGVPPRCRMVDLTLRDGTALRLSVDSPWIEREPSLLASPMFLLWFAASLALLAYVVARLTTAPLRRLVNAAGELGRDLHRPPLPLSGPVEVVQAATALNTMQRQLQQHLSERTHMLAAITHDLQTPLTRMRLRLERVPEEELRQRLVDDLNHMKALIDEGLELARSADTSEPLADVDLDSLLESVVEDAVDAGGDARLAQRCGTVLRLRPLAAQRMVANLVDNAVKYGGGATVSAAREQGRLVVSVRDRGPGLPAEMLSRVFEPFFRVEGSRSRTTGGVGLGLTIARMLAERNGATLQLRNHPDGGLECLLSWPAEASYSLRAT